MSVTSNYYYAVCVTNTLMGLKFINLGQDRHAAQQYSM